MASIRTVGAGLLLAAVLATPAFARQTSPSETANAAYAAQEWDKAAAAYESVTKSEPENGQAWYRLGSALMRLGTYDKAATALEHAEKLGFAPPFTSYNLACAEARLGHTDDALAWLGKSVDAGFAQPNAITSDDDLASLRDDARFKEIVERADRIANPCEYDPKARQLDFWVGEWTVFNPAGQQIGTNSLSKIDGGCVIQERWTDGFGGTGTSINFVDPADGKWKQTWVASNGSRIVMSGEFRDGAMRFEGTTVARNGTTSLHRTTLTPLPDGRVRQFIEGSTDGGKTWTAQFDGYYVRKKQS